MGADLIYTEHSDSPFVQQLKHVQGPPIIIRNDVDDLSPPENFKFVEDYKFGPGTVPPEPEAISGCNCRPENGRSIGCEYVQYCQCLEDVGRKDDGRSMGFPYYAVNEKKGCLRNAYLNERFAVYECNDRCNCGPGCKTKVVQRGRQIPLEIFKTANRGWGKSTSYVVPTLLTRLRSSLNLECPKRSVH